MNNKAIIKFGFRRIWRILQILLNAIQKLLIIGLLIDYAWLNADSFSRVWNIPTWVREGRDTYLWPFTARSRDRVRSYHRLYLFPSSVHATSSPGPSPRRFSKWRSAILKIVEEKALGTRLRPTLPILYNFMFNLNYLFQLFARPH